MSSKISQKTPFIPKPKVLVILGTTSAGKTGLAVKLAATLGAEIISADSRQVYKGMDIGTGKDLAEYKVNGKKIKYHLIDVVSPKQKFDLAKYQKLAFKAIEDVLSRGKLPIIVGGSGLYLQALVDNYVLTNAKPDLKKRAELEKLNLDELYKKLEKEKPEFAARLNNSDRNNKRRLVRYLEIIETPGEEGNKKGESKYEFLVTGLNCPDDILKIRILKRLNDRLEEGLVEEVKGLHHGGVSFERLIGFGLEYKFVTNYIQEKFEYEEMITKLNTALYRFAKRQKTWFRRWEKQGQKIEWLKDLDEAKEVVRKWINN